MEGNWKDGKQDGFWTSWYRNGQKQAEGSWKDDKRDRFWTLWHENGLKLQEGNWKDGKQYGVWTSWYRNEQKKQEGNWKDGKQDGFWTFWYENGQQQEEANWKDGKLVTITTWKPNGEKCPITNVVEGNGVLVLYNDDGTIQERVIFKNGEPVKTNLHQAQNQLSIRPASR